MSKAPTHRQAEIALRRERDGLRMFHALPHQDVVFTSDATEYLVLGANRGGKSVCAGARFAAVARDMPVRLSNGHLVDQRRPWQKNRPLIMWCIGLNWDHIRTMYRILFKAGLYSIVYDMNARGLFRAYRGEQHIKDKRQSFPLIPMSEVKGGFRGVSWENKKLEQFNRVTLTNGTIIEAYASTGDVKMGDPVDFIWIDEEIAILGHYAEWLARLSDHNGCLMWSTMPTTNAALLRVYERANEQRLEITEGTRTKADVDYCKMTLWDNPFIDQAVKEKRVAAFGDEDRRMRIEGDFIIDDLKIYPTFSRMIHAAVPHSAALDDAIAKILRERNGEPPPTWTRELVLDPGTQRPGVLLGAIPPPIDIHNGVEYELWSGHDEPPLIVYGELYRPRMDADAIARHVASISAGYMFERFIIDGHAAAQTPMGFAGTIGQRYSKAFADAGLLCRQTGSSFIYGDPSFETASALVQGAFRVLKHGKPRLRIAIDRCPALTRQVEFNLRAFSLGLDREKIVLDKEAKGQHNDMRRCLESWISRNPQYVKPPVAMPQDDWGRAMYQRLTKMFARPQAPSQVHIGAGVAEQRRIA